jgi:hypothetical protein
VYRDGEVHQYHALADEPPDAFAASAASGIASFTVPGAPVNLAGDDARQVLVSLLSALESSARGVPLDVPAPSR